MLLAVPPISSPKGKVPKGGKHIVVVFFWSFVLLCALRGEDGFFSVNNGRARNFSPEFNIGFVQQSQESLRIILKDDLRARHARQALQRQIPHGMLAE